MTSKLTRLAKDLSSARTLDTSQLAAHGDEAVGHRRHRELGARARLAERAQARREGGIGREPRHRVAQRLDVARRARRARIALTQGTPVASAVLITGLPQAIASSCTYPNASARVTDGSTNTSQATRSARSSWSSTSPGKLKRAGPDWRLASARHSSRIGPSPAITTSTARGAAASMSTSTPL